MIEKLNVMLSKELISIALVVTCTWCDCANSGYNDGHYSCPILGPICSSPCWMSLAEAVFYVNFQILLLTLVLIYNKLPGFPVIIIQIKFDWLGILLRATFLQVLFTVFQ